MKFSEALSALPLLPEAFLSLLAGRNRLRSVPAREIIADLKTGSGSATPSGYPEKVTQVSRAIRIGARLAPFRSDCLVQAMAAKAMLDRRGISSEFYIGVARPDASGFLAHAWLKSGGEIVVGGDVSSFTPLIEPG